MPPSTRPLDLSLDLIARAHSVPVPDDPSALAVLSDAELRPGLEAIVAGREGSDLWVFA
jgi:glutathione-specific gamma-glutamylcyclotransferase